jgi:hypothetical protein
MLIFGYIVLLTLLYSLLGDAEVSSLETTVPVRKGHNFGSDRLISLNI